MLETLEVGDVRKSDCHIAEIDSPLPVLKCLEDTDVNVDELDYLAKRLDCFADHELQQFQAMAAKKGYYRLKDLINLTFSCQQVTVISDFSDLEAIGGQHFMNTHYGITSPELARQKFRLIALDLLQNDLSAKITPYGVVYENDFWLDEVYDGKRFIGYEGRDCMMELDVMRGNKIAALYLPASEVQINRALERCGIQPDEFYNLHIVGSSFGVDLEEYLNTKYETIQSLNSMCEATAGTRAEKLGAIIRSTSTESTEQIVVLAQNADSFDFYPGIKTPEDYGKYFIQSSGHYEYDDELGEYYDYERFGKDRIAREHGVFDEAGCAVGAINTDCTVCAVNMSECQGKAPESAPVVEPEPDPEPEQSKATGNGGMLLLSLVVVVIGGGAGWYFKIYRPKKQRVAESEADYGGEYDGAEDYDETDPEDDGPPWGEDGEE